MKIREYSLSEVGNMYVGCDVYDHVANTVARTHGWDLVTFIDAKGNHFPTYAKPLLYPLHIMGDGHAERLMKYLWNNADILFCSDTDQQSWLSCIKPHNFDENEMTVYDAVMMQGEDDITSFYALIRLP